MATPAAAAPHAASSSSALTPAQSMDDHDEITLPDGSAYRGELSSKGQPHGQGRLQTPVDKDGGRSVSEGSFKNGKFDGVGVWSFSNGEQYEGEFSAGMPHGLGAQWDKDGNLDLCGRWATGLFAEECAVPLRRIPKGKYIRDAGQPHAAHHGLRCCASTLWLWLTPHPPFFCAACLQLNKCDASIQNTRCSAWPTTRASGFFIGEVNDRDQPHRTGVVFHPEGSVRNALLVDPVDASKNGRWINGKVNGRATELSYDGTGYEGSFKNGERDGLGVRRDGFGGYFEGEYAADKRNGLGACWDDDGRFIACGRWSKDKFVEDCAVPLRCLPEKKYLSAAGQSS